MNRYPVYNTRPRATSVYSGVSVVPSTRASSRAASLRSRSRASCPEDSEDGAVATGQEDYDDEMEPDSDLEVGPLGAVAVHDDASASGLEDPSLPQRVSGVSRQPMTMAQLPLAILKKSTIYKTIWNVFGPVPDEAQPAFPRDQASDFAIDPKTFCYGYQIAELERNKHIEMRDRNINTASNLSDNVAETEQVLAKVQEALAGLRQQRDHYVARADLSGAFLSTIRRVPLEVIGYICVICVFELGVSPWTLANISGQFRRAALDHRRLWAAITLDMHYAGQERFVDGYELCRTSSELKGALLRSGQAPLSIRVKTCDLDMAEQIALQKERWEDLCYNASSGPEVERALFAEKFTAPEATSLVHLTVSREFQEAENHPLVLWIQSLKLQSLVLHKHRLNLYPTTGWSGLTMLDIQCVEHQANATSADREATIVMSILKETKRTLQVLKLKRLKQNRFANGEDRMVFPELTTLVLITVIRWWLFVAPKVTDLYVKPWTMPPPPEHTCWSFPELETLRYEGERDGHHLSRVLQVPKLVTLVYPNTGKSSAGFIWEMETPTGKVQVLHPRILHMHNVEVQYSILTEGMRTLGDLSELHLHSSQLKGAFLRSLANEKGSFKKPTKQKKFKQERSLLLPQLTVLNVELAEGGWPHIQRMNRQNFLDAFQRIAAQRKKVLKQFTVKWPSLLQGGETTILP